MLRDTQRLPTNQSRKRIKLRSRGGCMNCKLRRRKCDEIKPTCRKCQQLGCQCQWLNDSSSVEQREWFEQRRAQRKQVELKYSTKGSDLSPTSAPRCLIADYGDLRISFLLNTLFKGANSTCLGADMSSLTVQTELHFADDTNSLTWGCLIAMANVHWGMKQNDRSILFAGLQAKGASLARMRTALSKDITSFSGDLLAAVALARLSETMVPASQFQWTVHAQGLTRLIDAMGPQPFKQPAMRRLLENNRWAMLTSASAHRRPTVLDSVAWRTVPWQDVSRKDMLQMLLDVYARMPGIHALWDEYTHSKSKERQTAIKAQLVARLRQIFLEMHQWRTSVNADIANSVKLWVPVEDAIPCSWKTAVSFAQLHHAYAMALFNMMVILLSRYVTRFPEVQSISKSLPINGPNQNQLLQSSLLPPRNPVDTAANAADEITMILPWAVQERFKGAGTLYMGAPAHVCYLFWHASEPTKSEWFKQAMQRISSCWTGLLLLDFDVLR